LTALIFGQHLKAFKNIKKWQLVQNEIGKVIINIIKSEDYMHEDENDILIKFTAVAKFDLEFNYVDDIQLTKRGKHLFLIQNINEIQ
jgi:phenylacetate-CoA ligase